MGRFARRGGNEETDLGSIKGIRKCRFRMVSFLGLTKFYPLIYKDVRNLTMPPPENTSFQFDMAVHSPTAMAVLEYDTELSRLRFQLVPAKYDNLFCTQ